MLRRGQVLIMLSRMYAIMILASVAAGMRPGWDESMDILRHDAQHRRTSKGETMQSIQVATSAHVIRRPSLNQRPAKSWHSTPMSDESNDTAKPAETLGNDTANPAEIWGLSFLQESQSSAKGPKTTEAKLVEHPEGFDAKQSSVQETVTTQAPGTTHGDDGEEDGEDAQGASNETRLNRSFIQLLGGAWALLPKVHALPGEVTERGLAMAMWLLAMFTVIGGFLLAVRLYCLCTRKESGKSFGLFAFSTCDRGAALSFAASSSAPSRSLDWWTDHAFRCALERESVERSSVADQVLLAQRMFPELVQQMASEMDRTPNPEVCNWAAKSLADVFLFLGLPPNGLKTGLSTEEASRRLALHGRNDVEAEHRGVFQVFLGVLQCRTSCLLLAAALLAAVLGDFLQSVVFVLSVLLAATIAAVADHCLCGTPQGVSEAQSSRSRCLRCSQWLWVPVCELVPGDIVRIVAGDRAFADLRIIAAENLCVDEILLSGVVGDTVEKHGKVEPLDEMGGLAENILYAHTNVISGSGIAVVVETGLKTRIARIFKCLIQAGGVASVAVRMLKSPCGQALESLGGPLITACLLANVVSIIAYGLLGVQDPDAPCAFGDTRCIWLRLIQVGLLMSAKITPETLAPWLATSLTVASNRFRRLGVVVRNARAMESLSACGVVCSDMSQIFTEGCLTAVSLFSSLPEPHTFEFEENTDADSATHRRRRIYLLDRSSRPRRMDEDLCTSESQEAVFVKNALTVACLNCYNVAQSEQADTGIAPPQAKHEAPILDLCHQCGLEPNNIWEQFPMVMEVPFTSASMLRATVHALPSGQHALPGFQLPSTTTHLAILKGAPDKLLPHLSRGLSHRERAGDWELCSRDPDLLQGLVESQNLRFASAALRVLLCAMAPLTQKEITYLDSVNGTDACREALLQNLVFVSLLSFRDPIRDQGRPGIDRCLMGGIRVVMVTGEQLPTAQAVARSIGIPGKAQLASTLRLSCGAFRPSAEILDLCAHVCVWARAQPDEKCAITDALQTLEKVCVVVAGSVEDVAALKQSDVGLVLGSGLSIAKHAADMILMDDSFAVVADAIASSRQTSANIAKAIVFWLGVNVGVFLAHMACMALRLPTPFSNLSVLWSLAATTLGALLLCWDATDPDSMMRGSQQRRPNYNQLRLQALLIWIALPCVVVGTTILGLTRHVGVVGSNHILDLCDYAWHPDGNAITSQGHAPTTNRVWMRDDSPYHCRCPAIDAIGVMGEQWGRKQNLQNNIKSELVRSTGFSGLAYAKNQGPFQDGVENTLEPCKQQVGMPNGALCWKEPFLALTPVAFSDGTESAIGQERPLFQNLLLHDEWRCNRYGTRLAKTMVWLATSLSEALFLQSMRSTRTLPRVFWRSSKSALVLISVVVVGLMSIYIPALQNALQLAPLPPKSLGIACAVPVGTFVLLEVSKAAMHRASSKESIDVQIIEGDDI